MTKIRLSSRLSTIANLVGDVDYVYDVGCDHALLDIYITKHRHNISCVAIDVNENVINQTKRKLKKLGLENKIQLLLNDGLVGLDIPDNSVIVISGLGTKVILNILKAAKLPKYLILQTNNDEYNLRKNVVKMGYLIEAEVYLEERGYKYVITKFKKGNKKYSSFNYFVSPFLIDNRDYLKYRLDRLTKHYSFEKDRFLKLRYKYWLFKINNQLKKLK